MEICALEGLDKQFWATKLGEFLIGDALKVVNSFDQADRQDYEKLIQALLIRFNYAAEGNRKCIMEYVPLKK